MQARVVELRFFAGLTNEEVAEVLNVSESTTTRDFRAAKAWLATQLK
jgi:DNA-directed RNA polymerase specialized sigma subunit